MPGFRGRQGEVAKGGREQEEDGVETVVGGVSEAAGVSAFNILLLRTATFKAKLSHSISLFPPSQQHQPLHPAQPVFTFPGGKAGPPYWCEESFVRSGIRYQGAGRGHKDYRCTFLGGW